MKRAIGILSVLVLAVSLLFATTQSFSEFNALISIGQFDEICETSLQKASLSASDTFYFGGSSVRPLAGFAGTFDMFVNPYGSVDSVSLGLGLEGYGGASFLFGEKGLFRFDLALGFGASENGWIRNLFVSLFDEETSPATYYTGLFADVSALFGDEDLSFRAGLRIGPFWSSASDVAYLSFTPYVAMGTGLVKNIFK